MASSTMLSIFLLLLSYMFSAAHSCNVSCVPRPRVKTLKFFCHALLSPASAPLKSKSVGLLGTPLFPIYYGSARVNDYKCTLTPNFTDPQYCRARGASFVDSNQNDTELIVNTLNFKRSSGSRFTGIISLVGQKTRNYKIPSRVGGVGDFFATSGDVQISDVSVFLQGDLTLFFSWLPLLFTPYTHRDSTVLKI